MFQLMNFENSGVWTSHEETLPGFRYIMGNYQEISLLRSSIVILTIKCALAYYVPREDIWNDDFLTPISPFSTYQGECILWTMKIIHNNIGDCAYFKVNLSRPLHTLAIFIPAFLTIHLQCFYQPLSINTRYFKKTTPPIQLMLPRHLSRKHIVK